jgi:hypothetical protein
MMSVSPSRPIAPVVAADHGGKKKHHRKCRYYNYTVKQKIATIHRSKGVFEAKVFCQIRERIWFGS